MKRLIILSLLVACDTPAEVNQFKAPEFAVVPTSSDVVYCAGQRMDVYDAPSTFVRPRPALIGIHGGAWLGGDKRNSGVLNFDIPKLRSKGYDVYMINYRVGFGSFPAFIEDAKCAVRYLRANAAFYGIDSSRIGVWGHSAGAHIAAMLAVLDDSLYTTGEFAGYSSLPAAVVGYAAPLDLTAGTDELRDSTQAYISRVFGDRAAEGSPFHHRDATDRPLYLVHGTLDESIGIAQAQRMGSPLLTIRNGGHYLTVPSFCKLVASGCYGAIASPARKIVTDSVIAFFKRAMK
jgi:acetyl esterase/lipase